MPGMATTDNDYTVMQARATRGTCHECSRPIQAGHFMHWNGRRPVACEGCNGDLAARGERERGPAVTLVVRTQDRARFTRDDFAIYGATVREVVDGDPPLRKGSVISVLGDNLRPGTELRVVGALTASNFRGRKGWDLRVSAIIEDRISDEGLEAFLCRLPDVGEERARAIVGKWRKVELLSILDKNPGRLTGIQGITRDRAEAIGVAYQEAKDLREAYEALGRLGAGPAVIAHAIKAWGKDVPAILEENPYRLMEPPKVGFLKADAMALKGGIGRQDPRRADAFALHLLKVAADSGHVWLDLDAVL